MIYRVVRKSDTVNVVFVIETGDLTFAEFVKDEMNARTGTFDYEAVQSDNGTSERY